MVGILTVGAKAQFEMLVSDEDRDYLAGFPWTFARSHPGTDHELVYARRTILLPGDPIWTPEGTIAGKKKKFDLFVHHVVLARNGEPLPPVEGWTADHENGDTLDNQRENLRWASPQMQWENNRRNRGHGANLAAAIKQIAAESRAVPW